MGHRQDLQREEGGRPCLTTLETAMRASARGFNVYDGSLRHSSFESITTQ